MAEPAHGASYADLQREIDKLRELLRAGLFTGVKDCFCPACITWISRVSETLGTTAPKFEILP